MWDEYQEYSRVISLLKVAGEIQDRKKLQKIVYILQMKGVGFNEKFTYHYYGPYSTELQMEVTSLSDWGFVSETSKQTESNHVCYTYSLKEGSDYENEYDDVQEVIDNAEIIKHLNSIPTHVLELIATIFYLKDYNYPTDENNKDFVRKKINALKPNLLNVFDEAWEKFIEIDKIQLKLII